MKLPEYLERQSRTHGKNFIRDYRAAVERIEDHTDAEDPYWHDTFALYSATPDGIVLDEAGSEFSPEDARAEAMGLLVLADLAEMQAAEPTDA